MAGPGTGYRRDMAGPMSRAATLAALTGLLAATGHVAGGGAPPDVAVLVLLLPLLGALLLGLAGRLRGPLAVLAVLGAGQAGLHVLLAVLHHHPGEAGIVSPAMLLGHTAATAATAVLLARADAVFTLLTAALRRVLPARPRTSAVDAPLPVRPVPGGTGTALVATLALDAHPRRGPPVAC